MKEFILFVSGIGVTLITSFITVAYLKKRLQPILVDLCGTEERADFWTTFSNITLILTPLIFATWFIPKFPGDMMGMLPNPLTGCVAITLFSTTNYQ